MQTRDKQNRFPRGFAIAHELHYKSLRGWGMGISNLRFSLPLVVIVTGLLAAYSSLAQDPTPASDDPTAPAVETAAVERELTPEEIEEIEREERALRKTMRYSLKMLRDQGFNPDLETFHIQKGSANTHRPTHEILFDEIGKSGESPFAVKCFLWEPDWDPEDPQAFLMATYRMRCHLHRRWQISRDMDYYSEGPRREAELQFGYADDLIRLEVSLEDELYRELNRHALDNSSTLTAEAENRKADFVERALMRQSTSWGELFSLRSRFAEMIEASDLLDESEPRRLSDNADRAFFAWAFDQLGFTVAGDAETIPTSGQCLPVSGALLHGVHYFPNHYGGNRVYRHRPPPVFVKVKYFDWPTQQEYQALPAEGSQSIHFVALIYSDSNCRNLVDAGFSYYSPDEIMELDPVASEYFLITDRHQTSEETSPYVRIPHLPDGEELSEDDQQRYHLLAALLRRSGYDFETLYPEGRNGRRFSFQHLSARDGDPLIRMTCHQGSRGEGNGERITISNCRGEFVRGEEMTASAESLRAYFAPDEEAAHFFLTRWASIFGFSIGMEPPAIAPPTPPANVSHAARFLEALFDYTSRDLERGALTGYLVETFEMTASELDPPLCNPQFYPAYFAPGDEGNAITHMVTTVHEDGTETEKQRFYQKPSYLKLEWQELIWDLTGDRDHLVLLSRLYHDSGCQNLATYGFALHPIAREFNPTVKEYFGL